MEVGTIQSSARKTLISSDAPVEGLDGYWTPMSDTVQFVVRHGYLVIFFWLLAEQAALPIPSIPLMLVSGALARTGQLRLSSIVLYALAGCLLADNIWFEIGRRFSGKALQFICKMSLEPDSCV